MRKFFLKINKIVVFALLLSLIFLSLSCSEIKQTQNISNDKIKVLVSLPPQAEFVEAVCKDTANVYIMVPPGASPHTYEPAPEQLIIAESACLYAKIGTPIEFENNWLKKITEMNKSLIVADCSKNIELIKIEEILETNKNQEHHGVDPHIWLSLRNAAVMTENIYQALIGLYPENAEFYKKNKDEYLNRIKILDEKLVGIFDNAQSRVFISYHDTWSYFARDYGLNQLAIEEDGKEPSPKKIIELIKQAENENVNIIFASPELNYSSANIIAEEIGGTVILISPLEKDYLKNMEKIGIELSRQLQK